MKKSIALVLALICMFSLIGCGSKESSVAGKVYTYENDGCGGAFTISIKEDGTFTYYEGLLSSYIGMGTWDINDSIITLTDDDDMGYPFVNHFRFDGNDLIFIEEDSSNFLYIDVKDDEIFQGEPIISVEQRK